MESHWPIIIVAVTGWIGIAVAVWQVGVWAVFVWLDARVRRVEQAIDNENAPLTDKQQ